MAIKITDKILVIPPYISTSWSHISALHMKGDILSITLTQGETVHIPNLNSGLIELIFNHHANYLEKEHSSIDENFSNLKEMKGEGESSIRFAIGSSLEEMSGMMQHNPDQADAPDLPPEVLQKIGGIAKILAPSEDILLPKAESGCNCFHCQIARALDASLPSHLSVETEPEVDDTDLNFQQWTITQTGEKLYLVVNRLDEHEKYHVYLGHPIGCTCGQEGCEHILAVLKS